MRLELRKCELCDKKFEVNVDNKISNNHIRTNKKYISYYTKSNSYRNLLFEYERWYNVEKIIPKDIKITPLMCYWWYVCDGFILNNNVYLCTDSFNEDNLLFIKIKLINNGFNASIRKNRISLDKKSSIDFLKWISNNIIIQKEYLYKWNIKNNQL